MKAVRCCALTAGGSRCARFTHISNMCKQHLRSIHHVRIGPSSIPGPLAGDGLFVTRARKKGDEIVPYEGKKRRKLPFDTTYVLRCKPHLFIDASNPTSGVGRYSNTARSFNATTDQGGRSNNARYTVDPRTGKAHIVATKAIKAGNEVLTAYGKGYGCPAATRKRKRGS